MLERNTVVGISMTKRAGEGLIAFRLASQTTIEILGRHICCSSKVVNWEAAVMRQVLDMLVWLGVIMVAVAVVYFAPRCAHSFAAMGTGHGQTCKTCQEFTTLNPDWAELNR